MLNNTFISFATWMITTHDSKGENMKHKEFEKAYARLVQHNILS